MTKKTAAELQIELKEQVEELRDRCAAYDAGKLWEAKNIAVTVYKLINDGPWQSLLTLLGLKKSMQFRSSGHPISEDALPRMSLAIIEANLPAGYPDIGEPWLEAVPLLADNVISGPRFLKFSKWWAEPIFEDRLKRRLTRKNLVFAFRNQDGGAHVDGELKDHTYGLLSKEADPRLTLDVTAGAEPGLWNVRIGFQFEDAGEMPNGTTLIGAHRASMRQIGWELDQSLIAIGL
ncbi:hypothetical protein [Mesorhizobium sp. M1378]|uniref:hypothetical protein n=1 Tax=Mesorhizobium sp. M1378 TaxID=2957092 RepID=UPI00333A4F92